MNSTTCSIFFHNYYGRHDDWIRFFSERINVPFTLFYNIVDDSVYNADSDTWLTELLQRKITGPYLQKIILRRSSNQGKDIGGKLVLLDSWLRFPVESDTVAFLHDKLSPHKIQNEEWKKKLFSIVEPDFLEKTLGIFAADSKTGIVASSENIKNEWDSSRQVFTSNNRSHLMELQAGYNVHLNDYSYVAGTMFWARAQPLVNFFKAHPPLDIRKTLEKGNIMDETGGSVTHAWERFFCWLIIAQGYELKGLNA